MQELSTQKQRKYKDVTGQKFNRLTALKYIRSLRESSGTRTVWLWRCDCGEEKEIRLNSVTTGTTKSCGCLSAPKKETFTCKFCNCNFLDYGFKRRVYCSSKCLGLAKLKKTKKEKRISMFEGQICTRCQTFKNFPEFHKNSASSTGFNFQCKECVKKYQEWLKQNPATERNLSRKERELNPIRKCNACELEKPVSDFSKHSNKKHIQYICKRCNIERATKRYHEIEKPSGRARLRNRKTTLKRYYNITLEEYEAMFLSQKGVCKTCGLPENRPDRTYLSVDHCHTTKKIRGLLCSNCNFALGYAKDNIETLEKMIEYLKSA